MILSEIRDYIKQRHQASLEDIINHFDIDEDTARAMLNVWINKQKIHCRNLTGSCNSQCKQCHQSLTEIYIWGQGTSCNTFINEVCQIKV